MKKILQNIIGYLDRFFFKEVSANGMGLMRIAWAATVLFFLFGSATDVVRYYSEVGTLPEDLWHLVFRSQYRYTLLTYISDPTAVIMLWCVFVVCLLSMLIGIWPKFMTVVSVLLLFSFHERNLQPLGGGDTVLRTLGFILLLAPDVSAFSIARLELQWERWKTTGTFLRPLRTSIWPYRLVLWEFMLIYLTSGWDKLQGTMWLDGTVVEAVFHHTHFVRWSKEVMDSLVWMSPYASAYTIIWEFSWLLLLIPRELWWVLPVWMKKFSIRRMVVYGGLLFHWGLFVLMDVGTFPFAVTTGYLGLILDRDIVAFKRNANRRWKGKIVVLYDGGCNLCRRSIFFVQLCDWLDRIQPVDFRNLAMRKKYAAKISEEDLDRAMHIKMPGGSYFKGFFAFRKLSWSLPAMRIFTPLLYIPGVSPIGVRVYAKIAESRNRCASGTCVHKT